MSANLIALETQLTIGPRCEPSTMGLLPDFDPQDEPEEPTDLEPDGPTEPSDFEYVDIPCTDEDSRWDVFLPDDDERDPQPDAGDFWFEANDESTGIPR